MKGDYLRIREKMRKDWRRKQIRTGSIIRRHTRRRRRRSTSRRRGRRRARRIKRKEDEEDDEEQEEDAKGTGSLMAAPHLTLPFCFCFVHSKTKKANF